MKEFLSLIKQIAKVSSKKLRILAGAGLATGVLAASITTFAGWTPDRPVYNWNNEADRVGSLNGPRMNAFINTPYYGDERGFFDACRGNLSACASANNGVFKDVLSDATTSGNRVVTLRTYIHNGANQSTNDDSGDTNGVAKDAKIRIDLPTATESALRMRSYISISNAADGYPDTVTDTTEIIDNKPFSVKYVPGSAKIFTEKLNGATLSDSIVTSGGAPIGYDALNGEIPGCFEFQAFVTIQVEISVVEHKLEKVVRKAAPEGATPAEYGKLTTVKPGEKVQWRLFWENTGDKNITELALTDQLAPHMAIVSGSVRWIYKDGTTGQNRDVVQPDNDLFTKWVPFGDTWEPDDDFFVRFDTTAKDDFSGCEVTVRNLAHAHNKQLPEDITDFADVKIVKENCVPPPTPTPPAKPPVTQVKQLPVTGPESALGLFSATSAIGYVAHRLRTLRKIK